jgi:hypothetical protein
MSYFFGGKTRLRNNYGLSVDYEGNVAALADHSDNPLQALSAQKSPTPAANQLVAASTTVAVGRRQTCRGNGIATPPAASTPNA